MLVIKTLSEKYFSRQQVKESMSSLDIFQKNEIYYGGERVTNTNSLKQYSLKITGKNNRLYLNKFLGSGKISITITGDNNLFSIGQDCTIVHGLRVLFTPAAGMAEQGLRPQGVTISIGDHNRFQGNVTFLSSLDAGRVIKIGNHCLFAEGVFFRGRSEHLIYDINTKQRVNNEADIILENNIWIGSSVDLLPKTRISSNSIVAMRSLVNTPFSVENVLLAGMPAEIKKENVMWHVNVDQTDFSSDYPI